MPTNIKIADAAKDWLDMLYQAGAVTVNAAGETEIHGGVRQQISAIHDLLAANDPNLKQELESKFDAAVQETSGYNQQHPGTLLI